MRAPLGILSLLLGILVFTASLLQKQVAVWVGNPMQEKSTIEKTMDLFKGSSGSANWAEIPQHPVAATIFWLGLAIVALSLLAWIMEDSFWKPLIAASLGLGAAFLHMAWVPGLIALIQLGRGKMSGRRKTNSRRRISSSRSSRSRTGSRPWTRTNRPD